MPTPTGLCEHGTPLDDDCWLCSEKKSAIQAQAIITDLECTGMLPYVVKILAEKWINATDELDKQRRALQLERDQLAEKLAALKHECDDLQAALLSRLR